MASEGEEAHESSRRALRGIARVDLYGGNMLEIMRVL
jgi:hypothetical protein